MTTLDTHALALLNAEDMAAFQADHDYVDEHFDDWLQEYLDHWVVVKNRTRLLVTKSEDEVRAAIKEHGNSVVVDFLHPRGYQRVVGSASTATPR